MKIAYLASKLTLPSNSRKLSDALEHDQMMSVLRSAFLSESSSIDDIAWDDETVNWNDYHAAVIGTSWDYCDRADEFLETLNKIGSQTPVFNSPSLVAWNSHKTYLRILQEKGVQVIPTKWVDISENVFDSPALFEQFDTDRLVFKRQVGANAEGQFLLNKGDEVPKLTHPMMVQPFLSAVADEGEYSFIFLDGELSHALIKRPKSGDYRIQSSYGGIESAITPSAKDLLMARSALDALRVETNEIPLYARVDMLRDDNGKLSLMELELIEPFLYPMQGQNLGKHILHALKKRLN